MSFLEIFGDSRANRGGRGRWRARRERLQGGRRLRVEPLESRALLSVTLPVLPGYAAPFHIAPSDVASMATAGPTGFTPAEIRAVYGFDKISFNSGTVPGDGSGTTIAIVDAYDDPNIANDLRQFDAAFGLPDPVFTKVSQTGSPTALPAADAGWATEIALDVEWAHAVAPAANILLVEAGSNSFSDLLTAVNYARNATGVVAVSMSWGGGEFSGESSYDSYFTTPSGHAGVTFVASSGDSGAPASYPAISPNVLSVGGTTLFLNSQGGYSSESGWSGSGGGISSYESQPAYQNGVVTQTSAYRASPDVAYDSNPATGFSVYDSYNNGTSTPWGQWGGTSDAAPQWAALVAIADQGRALAGEAALNGAATLAMLYALPAGDFHDITSGTSTGRPNETSGAGYDLVTGRGSPIANLVVGALVGTPSQSSPTQNPPAGTVASGAVTAGLYSPGSSVFYLRNSNDGGGADLTFQFGTAGSGWTPIVGDWNGDGVATIGLYNPVTSVFELRNSNSVGSPDMTFQYGPAGSGWIPVAGDWNGAGRDTVGLYDPRTATFYLRNSNDAGVADEVFSYGPAGSGWTPVAGDWNGDGMATVGLFDAKASTFYLRNSNSAGVADLAFQYGPANAGWRPVAGDWSGSGQATVGLYNPATSVFYLRNSNSAGVADAMFVYGWTNNGFIPIVGNWDGLASPARAAAGSGTGPQAITGVLRAAMAWAATQAGGNGVYQEKDAVDNSWPSGPTNVDDGSSTGLMSSRATANSLAGESVDVLTAVMDEMGYSPRVRNSETPIPTNVSLSIGAKATPSIIADDVRGNGPIDTKVLDEVFASLLVPVARLG